MPLRRARFPAAAVAAVLIGLAFWVKPAAAPPFGPHPKASEFDRYAQAARHGHPVAVLHSAVALRATPGGIELARLASRTEWGSPRVLAVVGRRGSWLKVIATELRNGHRGWVPLGAAQLLANPWSVHADISARRVTVLRAGHVVRRFRVGVGAAATPTPEGDFAVTDKLTLTGGSPNYGCCALALTGHQPHIRQGWKGGDRLAIHGTRVPGSIGRAASSGCLRAGERDARWVVSHVWLGTIVEVRR